VKKLLAVMSGAALMFCGLAGSSATAAPAAAPPPTAPVASSLTVGTLLPTRARQDGIKLRTHENTSVRMFTLTYAAGVKSGWHVHPGIVLATVEKGTVIQQVGCRSYRRTAGESFTEVAPHQVSNPSTVAGAAGDAVLRITQIVPADAEELREPVAPPRCHGWR